MTKILYVCNSSRFFLSHRSDLALAAVKDGYEVHLASPLDADNDILQLEKLGLIYHQYPLSRSGASFIREASSIFSLLRIIGKIRPDLLHNITIKPILYGSMISNLYGIPSINLVTGLGYAFSSFTLKTGLLKSVIMIMCKVAMSPSRNIMIFQNNDDRALFLKHKLVQRYQTKLIKGSGVDPNLYMTSKSKSPRITVILAARMLWLKGVGDFVNAAKIIQSKTCETRFLLAGGLDLANPSAISKETLMKWQHAGVIEWLGHQDNMLDVFSLADIICLPTHYREGIPKVLIEAASCALPIVTTNSAGCNEIVRDNYNGFLIQSGDVNGLVDALKRLINDASLRNEMGRRGRDMVKAEFSTDIIIKQTLNVYKELLVDHD